MDVPWDDCKIAYGIDDDASLWRRYDSGKLELPAGWSLDQVDGAGARFVVVFRVKELPYVEDGRAVLSMLRRIRAITPWPRKRAA
jgi:hypothetical protein